jgi:hypothetical protein
MALSASVKSPVETPFKYNQGIRASMLLAFLTYFGTMPEVNLILSASGSWSLLLGTFTGTGPIPV